MKNFNMLYPIVAIVFQFVGCTQNVDEALIKVQDFNHKLNSRGEFADELLDIDEAVYLVEATLNYNYCNTSVPFGEIFVDSAEIEVPLHKQKSVYFKDVALGYDQIVETLAKHYYKGAHSDTVKKHLLVVDLKRNGKGGKFNMLFWMGKGLSIPLQFQHFSQPAHYQLADGQIEGVINNFKLLPLAGTWFDNVEVKPAGGEAYWALGVPEFPNPNDLTPHDNFYDYLMFYNNTGLPDFHEELSVAELNFYLKGTMKVIHMMKPSGKVPISVDLWDDLIPSMPDYPIFHMGCFTYGEKHFHLHPLMRFALD